QHPSKGCSVSIPTWHEFMAPILRAMSDGSVRDRSEITEAAADDVHLTETDRAVTLTTGQPMYANRVGWAISHLTQSGALSRPERSRYVINDLGWSLLLGHPAVTRADVGSATGYRRARSTQSGAPEVIENVDSLNPAELIDQGIKHTHAE